MADAPPRLIEVACLVLRNRRGEILAARRPPGGNLAGKWEFPGGKLEPGEPAEAALRREILEELGLDDLGGLTPLTPVTHAYDFGVIRLIPFAGTLDEPLLRPAEHDAVVWLPLADLPTLDWAPADWPILREVLA